MPKIENIKVYGLENAIRCAKFPMAVDTQAVNSQLTDGIKALGNCKTGTGHDTFLNGVIVQFDLTFSNKAWVEAERYHFFDFISSQSTMHRIAKFKLKEQCNKYVDPRIVDIVQEKINEYNELLESGDKAWEWNKSAGANQEQIKKNLYNLYYLEILYNIPSGFELTAGITTNYRQLKTIYQQRRTHRLPDWQMFCNACEELPMFKELCISGKAKAIKINTPIVQWTGDNMDEIFALDSESNLKNPNINSRIWFNRKQISVATETEVKDGDVGSWVMKDDHGELHLFDENVFGKE